MNHFDDRVSYFAHLRESGRLTACLDANAQADVSLTPYGWWRGCVYWWVFCADV